MKRKIKVILYVLAIMVVFSLNIVSVNAINENQCDHEFVDIVVEPTCNKPGFTHHKCNKCGKEYKDNYISCLGHDYEKIIVQPTCTADGFTSFVCKICGYQYQDNYVKAKGHKYTDVVFTPTCESEGYTIHKCDECQHEYIDNYVSPIQHDYIDIVTLPTCKTDGFTTHTCSKCGKSYKDSIVKATGHNYVEKIVNPTCVAYGYSQHICSCGDKYITDYVKPLGHDYITEIIPASKNGTGFIKHICKSCGHTYLSDFVTSGDDGYIPKPDKPPVHIHSYSLTTTVDRLNKTILLDYKCLCGHNNEDLLTVIFTDNKDNIISLSPKDKLVDFSELSGDYIVSVIDNSGQVLKSFTIAKDNPSPPIIDNPIPLPDNDHNHSCILKVDKNEISNIFTISYICSKCNKNMLELLNILLKDKNGNLIVQDILNGGIVDLSDKDISSLIINDSQGNLLKEIIVQENSLIDSEIEKPVSENKSNFALNIVLIVFFVLLVLGAIIVFIVIKKRKKNSNTKEINI